MQKEAKSELKLLNKPPQSDPFSFQKHFRKFQKLKNYPKKPPKPKIKKKYSKDSEGGKI